MGPGQSPATQSNGSHHEAHNIYDFSAGHIRQPPRLGRGDLHLSAERVQCGPEVCSAPPPAPPAFKEAAPAAYSSAPPGAWQPAQPQDAALKGKWWEMFNEPELNALEDRLNIDNQNIAQYFQNFMAARAQVREAHTGYYPTVTVNPSVTNSRTSTSSSTTSPIISTGSSSTGTGTIDRKSVV